ncbi:hypothetical protein INR49_000776 [Caranx melampygus]|nr:hypothetical protein INR49_000776 [Caranx melampygus]
MNVVSFSNGSIINNMDVSFASTSVPNNTQIGNVLINAASNITAFNIEASSVSVDGTGKYFFNDNVSKWYIMYITIC